MKVLLFIIITLIFVSFTGINGKRGRVRIMTKKQKICVASAILISLFVVYSFITLILAIVRSDSFNAYEVYISDTKYIYYQDAYYVEIIDQEELNMLNEEIDGEWINEKEIVLKNPVKFPYIDYWVPDIICNHLYHTQEDRYILITYAFSGANEVYVRVE